MKVQEQAEKIREAIAEVSAKIDALAEVGRGNPAIEKNMIRMKGTLNALKVQFNFVK